MKYHYSAILFLVAANHFSNVIGFTQTIQSCSSSITALRATSEEERAGLLSDYLVKSHLEKLEAVKRVESEKDAAINSLKEQLEEAKATSALIPASQPTTGGALVSSDHLEALSKEELIAKVLNAEKFIAKYMIDAQEQKLKAVKAAEQAMAKKLGATVAETPPPLSQSKDTTAYEKRSEKVKAEAAAGKSRWGEKELERVNKVQPISVNGKSSPGKSKPAVEPVEVPPEVVAADHGMRNDGGVGGPTLAERVAQGANNVEGSVAKAAPSASSPPPVLSYTRMVFEARNARVAEAAKAGKSRWGEVENDKAILAAANPPLNGASAEVIASSEPEVPIPQEVLDADHGMRADGGVGGPTLAERVNLGARILGGK